MSLTAILALGFFLGMRHATDADHVVAVSTIVSRKRSLQAAIPIGILWGIGHTFTIMFVGGAIILFGVVIPPHLGLGMEFSVAMMLIVLGGMNLHSILRDVAKIAPGEGGDALHGHPHGPNPPQGPLSRFRPLMVGIVHGLAGSAAVALLVLGTIRSPMQGAAYLVVFGIGTIVGMLVITVVLAVPVVAAARFQRVHQALGIVTGIASVAFGAILVYEIGFVHGLFTGHPQWKPE